jgi:hypothetical protein
MAVRGLRCVCVCVVRLLTGRGLRGVVRAVWVSCRGGGEGGVGVGASGVHSPWSYGGGGGTDTVRCSGSLPRSLQL